MKSAYELAMERLEAEQPQVALTEEQKQRLGELDELYKAKIAEKEVFLDGLIEKAMSEGNFEELVQLKEQRTREIQLLEDKREEEKEAVRQPS